MAPGVGKTYEMLSGRARRQGRGRRRRHRRGRDPRPRETEALLDGLEILPRQPIEYRGRELEEFDIDAALARKPALLLVDECAHSNAPGSRHPKRWQDVEELLAAGIDVWTTLNVQHLESLVDVVWRITGVRQRETVPDRRPVARRRDRDRRHHPGRAAPAPGRRQGLRARDRPRAPSQNFFKPENLTALRELALRRAAERVDDQMVDYLRQSVIEGPWATAERLLVCFDCNS